MLPYPNFDPVAIRLGPLSVRWYGLMYAVGFGAAWLLGRLRAKQAWRGWRPAQFEDLLSWIVLGVVLGGRLGYVLFYDPVHYLHQPLDVFAVWNGGMSFHGGVIGVSLVLLLFARRTGRSPLDVGDFVVPLIPPGLFCGRLGNFINGELWGRPTTMPWAMRFPEAGPWGRHPSQLYEAGLEGLVLFAVLWWYSSKPRRRGAVSGVFLMGYALFRAFVEFFREPDAQLGYLAFGWLTMGQLLCVPMLLCGLWLFLRPAEVPGAQKS